MSTAVYMFVTPNTHIPSSPQSGRLTEDATKPTPSLTIVTVIGSATSNHGTYSSTGHTAICNLTSTDYTSLYNLLLGSAQVRVDLTYDESASGNNKPITYGPVFSTV